MRWRALLLSLFVLPSMGQAEPAAVRLDFGTFLGGPGGIREITFDSAGFIVVAGHPAPPRENVPDATVIGPATGSSAWVGKLTPDGARFVWFTIIGGSGIDRGYGVALDAHDNVYVTGRTSSLDFPTTPGAFDRTNNGGGCLGPHGCGLDGYVLKLTPDGRRLVYSTYLGGSGTDGFRGGIAVDAEGAAYCVGSATPTDDYPGAINRYLGGRTDGMIAKLSPDGSEVVYSRFLGSPTGRKPGEGLFGVATTNDGRVLVHGSVSSAGAATTPDAYDRSHNGKTDAYYAELAQADGALLHATYLGGSGDEYAEHGVVYDASRDDVYLVGQTRSDDFPTVGGHVSPTRGGPDAYVLRLGPDRRPIFTAVLGGSGEETALGPGVDARGNVFVTGQTRSADFEVTANALDKTLTGGIDTFLQIYSPSGALRYSSFLGGSGGEFARFVTADPRGRAVLGGTAMSPDFPTTPGALYPKPLGKGNAFLAGFSIVGPAEPVEPAVEPEP